MSLRPKLTLSSSVPPPDEAWAEAARSSTPPGHEENADEELGEEPPPESIEPEPESESDDSEPAPQARPSMVPQRASVVPRMPSVMPPPPDRHERKNERRSAREPQSLVAQLAEFPALSKDQRRVAFRQILAELGRGALDDGPSPLEGLRAEALTHAVVVATDDGLFDDMDWLSLGQGGAALCLLAATLPAGNEQRDLGRRGLSRLLTADASAFATIATQLARAGGRAFFAPAVAARVALLFEMPLALDLNDTTLAFTIASRRTLATRYVVEPSTRSLPERRLAARILERATRLAVQRAESGDRSGLRLVGPDGNLAPVWQRLLADREPLVWRHVALARGLLTPPTRDGVRELEARFHASLTPTEWRRAAVMLGGFALRDGPLALDLSLRVFEQGLLLRDSGAASGFVFALGRVAVSEPELARELFDLATPKNPADMAEGVISLARELGECPFLDYARRAALARLSSLRTSADDEGLVVLRRELSPDDDDDVGAFVSLTKQSEEALAIFHRAGAAGALAAGHKILDAARSALDTLTALDRDDEESPLARRTSFGVVRDLDLGFLERDVIANLMRLDTREARVKNAEEVVEHLRDRLFQWLVDRALRPRPQGLPSKVSGEHAIPTKLDHVAVHLGRVRAFLHLVDGDALGRSEDGDRLTVVRVRRALRALTVVFQSGPPGPLRRAMLAAFARCLDALVRAGACDVSDALLVALSTLKESRDLEALAEAAMDPDVARLLVAASALWGKEPPRPGGSIPVTIDSEPVPTVTSRPALVALEALAEVLADVGTARSDGLRAVLLKLHHGFSLMSASRSLRSLSGHAGSNMLGTIESAAFALTQLFAGAEARIFDEVSRIPSRAPSNALSSLVEGALQRDTAIDLGSTRTPAAALSEGLATWFVTMFSGELRALEVVPLDAPAEEILKDTGPIELPAWIPARRTLGAFWVERPLAEGGVGSVFVVTRTEDRFDQRAERFALKVPDYNANAARHLSEAEFLAIFRGEASALVSLPQHDSLARFVTFDLAARPKPILVMELVEGPNLERVIDTRALSWDSAVATIHQVTSGLSAMHVAGIGHLDLKPANVVIRRSTQAVLVDFGLAGRSIRPGCGSAPYAAPEVWNHDSADGSPLAADMYSLGCLVFETLTGEVLFDGDNELNVIAKHLAHDGFPQKLRSLASQSKHAALAELLFSVLRRDPADRMHIEEFDASLKKLMSRYQTRDWPLRVPQQR